MAASSLEKYNRSLAAVRERFDANPALNAVRSNDDPQMLELFLLYFCAIGAQMTQPVEGWIRRAASRCAELGFEELAKALNQHAQAESGHHLMMIADVHSLVKHWNSRHSRPECSKWTPRTATCRSSSRSTDAVTVGWVCCAACEFRRRSDDRSDRSSRHARCRRSAECESSRARRSALDA